MHTLSLIHGLVLELAAVEDGPSSSSSPSSDSEIDPEEARKNEELGLGGATLKAVISELKGGLDGSGGLSTGPATGGEVLTILHERMQRMSGDPGALSLHKALIRAAGRPYAEMLVGWIRHGELNDPYEEMCVKEGKYISKTILDQDYVDDYWERRYTVCSLIIVTTSADGPSIAQGWDNRKRSEASGWSTPTKSAWWKATWWCLYTTLARNLET